MSVFDWHLTRLGALAALAGIAAGTMAPGWSRSGIAKVYLFHPG